MKDGLKFCTQCGGKLSGMDREQNGAYGIWKAVDTFGNQLFVNGKTLEIDVRVIDNEFVVFDLRIDNQIFKILAVYYFCFSFITYSCRGIDYNVLL